MPYRAWPQPFSSVDIPDDEWNSAAAQWRAAQGQYDPVAPSSLDDVEVGGDVDPTSPDTSRVLGQAEMPHDQWQKARMMQLAAREGGDGSPPQPGETSRNSDADPQAQQFAAFRTLMAGPEEEGRRNEVYLDSLGNPTVGIGHLVQPGDKLKLGDKITDPQVDAYFQKDGATALQRARDQAAQAGISDPGFITRLGAVNFQLGRKTWPGAFPKTWNKILAGDYNGAAVEAADSKWFREQTPRRVQAFQSALRALPPRSRP
jgi:GH24 family phage-related lysozyme (muramidase)